MSKKLIAVAAAAALALTGLVVMPTVATATPGTTGVGPFAIAVDGMVTNHTTRDGSTAAKSALINVPSSDVLRYEASSLAVGANTKVSALKISVQTPGTTDAITITTTGGAEVITATQYAATSPASTTATGVTSLTIPAVDGDASFYAYTTSTAVSTVVISAAGSSQTVHISGLSTFGYKMAFTAPATAAIGGEFSITGTVKDAFGNDLTTALVVGDFTVTGLGGSPVPTVDTAKFDYNATTKVYEIVMDNRTTAGGAAVSVLLAAPVTANSVTAFGTRVVTQFFTVNAVDLATQVTALTAQVAALTADYNALAVRWNKKVDSKRKVFKKVALK